MCDSFRSLKKKFQIFFIKFQKIYLTEQKILNLIVLIKLSINLKIASNDDLSPFKSYLNKKNIALCQ